MTIKAWVNQFSKTIILVTIWVGSYSSIINGWALSRAVIYFKGHFMLYFGPQVCARNAWLSTVILRKIVSDCERSVRWEERVASVLIRGIAGSGVVAEFWPKVMSWQRWGGVARNARCTLLLLLSLLLLLLVLLLLMLLGVILPDKIGVERWWDYWL